MLQLVEADTRQVYISVVNPLLSARLAGMMEHGDFTAQVGGGLFSVPFRRRQTAERVRTLRAVGGSQRKFVPFGFLAAVSGDSNCGQSANPSLILSLHASMLSGDPRSQARTLGNLDALPLEPKALFFVYDSLDRVPDVSVPTGSPGSTYCCPDDEDE